MLTFPEAKNRWEASAQELLDSPEIEINKTLLSSRFFVKLDYAAVVDPGFTKGGA